MSLSTHARLFAIALAVGVASVQPALAQETPPQQRQPGAAASLENSMKAMNRAYKAIGRQIDDAGKDENTLKLASDLQAATAAAKGQLPDEVAKLEGEAKTKAAAEYRAAMLLSLKTTIELEEALAAGNREGAKAAYAKIDGQMRDGHKAYRVKDH